MTLKNQIRVGSLISFYPVISTFLMTLIWQLSGQYLTPFLGGYYFKWVFLYTENNPNWLTEAYLPLTRVLYFIYLGGYLLLVVLTLLVLFRFRGKAVCTWCICGLWLADCGFAVADMIQSGVAWQTFVLLGEHLLFIAAAVLFSIRYLQLKKAEPELFRPRKRPKKGYRRRFQ